MKSAPLHLPREVRELFQPGMKKAFIEDARAIACSFGWPATAHKPKETTMPDTDSIRDLATRFVDTVVGATIAHYRERLQGALAASMGDEVAFYCADGPVYASEWTFRGRDKNGRPVSERGLPFGRSRRSHPRRPPPASARRIIPCRWPRCRRPSKGPRFHFLCEAHRGQWKAFQKTRRK